MCNLYKNCPFLEILGLIFGKFFELFENFLKKFKKFCKFSISFRIFREFKKFSPFSSVPLFAFLGVSRMPVRSLCVRNGRSMIAPTGLL